MHFENIKGEILIFLNFLLFLHFQSILQQFHVTLLIFRAQFYAEDFW